MFYKQRCVTCCWYARLLPLPQTTNGGRYDLAMDGSGYMCCQQQLRIVWAIICFNNFTGLKNYCKLRTLNNGYEKAALYAVVIFTIFYC